MIIACDVDGVVCDLQTPWLAAYNAEFNDNLTPAHIVEWDMHKLVKKECGTQIYKYLKSDLYDTAPVYPGAQAGVQALRDMGHRVVFVTTCVKGMTDFKWDWLERHGFLPKGKHNQPDLITAADKALIAANLLIDDKADTIKNWIAVRKRRAFLFQQPWNVNTLLDEPSAFWLWAKRATGWPEIVQTMGEV